MKLIFITDTHGMASNPGSRLDVFSEALLKKMEYIGQYAKEIGATAILHGGDWLHTPDVSESFIREIARIVHSYPCPTFGVLGNHDIYGYNPTTFNRTSLGVAEGVGVFVRLGSTPIFLEGEGEVVALTGQDSTFDLDKPGHEGMYTDTPSHETYMGKPCTDIHIVHGMLVEKEWPQVACTVISDIKDRCAADIILTGHEHTGFGVKRYSDVTFCNPGSLARVTAGTGDVRKDVRMAVITVEGNNYDIELVNLPIDVARPASEVLDTDKLAEEKANKENLQKFITKMNNTTVQQDFNVYESLNRLCEDQDIEDKVMEECRRQLEKAEESLNTIED